MGYYMSQHSGQVLIKKENFSNVVAAIHSLVGKESITDSGGRHFSWVSNDFAQEYDVCKLLQKWRWAPNLNQDGDIFELNFIGEKYGDDPLLFRTIAPFIESGYIEMIGEDGERWRWVFENGKFKEVQAKIIWD